jgi:hypothetical protein
MTESPHKELRNGSLPPIIVTISGKFASPARAGLQP